MPSPLKELRELFAYNRWANDRLLSRCRALSDDEFTRPLGGSFGSLRETWAHVLGAEWIWLERWNGASPPGFPTTWDLASWNAVYARWQEITRDQAAFLERLTDQLLHTPVSYRNMAGTTFADPLWQLMRHVVNHSTYHRGQVTLLLRQLGHEAVSTDLVLYHRELCAAANG